MEKCLYFLALLIASQNPITNFFRQCIPQGVSGPEREGGREGGKESNLRRSEARAATLPSATMNRVILFDTRPEYGSKQAFCSFVCVLGIGREEEAGNYTEKNNVYTTHTQKQEELTTSRH